MIYIFTALYCEAHMFIRRFCLTKNLKNTRFQEFCNEAEGIRLTVTGAGEISAAAAVAGVCTAYGPGREDMLLNAGVCAHTAGGDGIYLCNRITELSTGRDFYPDLLYRHGFREAAVVTGMTPWDGETERFEQPDAFSRGYLYDMEAAAVWQAGSYFFGPHQMMFLKIVSDRGTPEDVSAERVEQLMETYLDPAADYIRQLQTAAHKAAGKEGDMRREEEAQLGKLCADLHCSETMRASVKRYIRYLALEGADYASVIREMYREGRLPCRDKREGKLRFEELKRRLF